MPQGVFRYTFQSFYQILTCFWNPRNTITQIGRRNKNNEKINCSLPTQLRKREKNRCESEQFCPKHSIDLMRRPLYLSNRHACNLLITTLRELEGTKTSLVPTQIDTVIKIIKRGQVFPHKRLEHKIRH